MAGPVPSLVLCPGFFGIPLSSQPVHGFISIYLYLLSSPLGPDVHSNSAQAKHIPRPPSGRVPRGLRLEKADNRQEFQRVLP